MGAPVIKERLVGFAPEDQPAMIYEAASAIHKNGGFTVDGLKKSQRLLKDIGIDLDQEGKLKKFVEIGKTPIASFVDGKTSVSLAAPDNSQIGPNTFEISNQLIQDISPENPVENSPYNLMMPYKNVNAITYQQDVMSSNWGWADGSNGVNGSPNIVSLLESTSNKFKGYLIDEWSFLEGMDLVALREVGTSETERRGATQKLNYGMLNLLQRAATGLEMNRIEMLYKGSWTYKQGSLPDPLIISGQVPGSNVTTLSQVLGTYTASTNVFVANTGLTVNPLVELGNALTTIKNMGLEIEKITMDNICYGAIFNCAAVTQQTQYISMNSGNNIPDIRTNLFKITNIPALQDVFIEVDNRAVKFNSDKTTRRNTRPIVWGKEVSASSFRALICIKPKGLSRLGDFGFFPNPYARTTSIGGGSRTIGGFGGGIVMVNQDLSTQNIANQKIQLLAASASAPMPYLTNILFTFNFNVTIA